MKKTIVLFSTLALLSVSSIAQNKDVKRVDASKPADRVQSVMSTPVPATAPTKATPNDVRQAAPATPAAPALNADLSIKFGETNHNFGNIPEGPSASYDFEFKNIGKVPIIFSDVHGSCGCTVPVWPKEPILPGKSSKIAVTYSTQGRVGAINKTVTVTSNIGTKILQISGNVDKAADAQHPTPVAPADTKH